MVLFGYAAVGTSVLEQYVFGSWKVSFPVDVIKECFAIIIFLDRFLNYCLSSFGMGSPKQVFK